MRNLFILLVVLVVGVGIYWGVKKGGTHQDEQVFCTQEALICPDGSGVGRSGPHCEFTACPNQDSFTGKLVQQGEGFVLAVAAPADILPGVTYAIPLKFSKIGNIPTDLIDKTVLVTGKFSWGSTLEVDTIEQALGDEATTGEVKVGETKFINGVQVTVNKITEDSRCAIDVTCVWAGRLMASIRVKSDTDTETHDLVLGAEAHPFDTYKISLISALPIPRSTEPTSSRDYRLTIKVEDN